MLWITRKRITHAHHVIQQNSATTNILLKIIVLFFRNTSQFSFFPMQLHPCPCFNTFMTNVNKKCIALLIIVKVFFFFFLVIRCGSSLLTGGGKLTRQNLTLHRCFLISSSALKFKEDYSFTIQGPKFRANSHVCQGLQFSTAAL